LVPKSVFIKTSINSSIDNTSSFNDSFNDSIKELMEFGQRTLKSGQVLIDLRSVFDTAFPNVKIKAIDRVILGRNKKQIKVWQATAIRVNRGEQMMLLAGYSPTMPRSNLSLEDHSTWYYKKMVAITALMWYNLTAKADTHWRKRWFLHLLGGESEVLLRRSLSHEEDAVVQLLIIQKSNSNKKKFVISYPIG
jgi:hypothetical protein